YEQDTSGALSYPFTVRPSNVGYASAAIGDKSRAEIWLPLWEKFTPWEDLQALFREGRAKFNQRMAVDGVDFACAIAQLGITRGISEFIRYSFQERNGLSYFAIPLGRFKVQSNPQVDLLAPLDGWLRRLKSIANADNTPASLQRAYRRLETAILKLTQSSESQRGEKLLDILISLGEVEATLDRAYRSKEAQDKALNPLLIKDSKKWLQECQEDSPEFHLALALAGQNLRERLVWVRYNEKGKPYWLDNDDKRTVWQQGATLEQNLIAWLKRLDIETQQQEKNNEQPEENAPTPPTVSLKYLYQWLMEDTEKPTIDERRIEALARGLSLLNLQDYKRSYSPDKPPLPASYALLKLVHYRHLTDKRLQVLATNVFPSEPLTLAAKPLPPVPGLLTQLAIGNEARATQLAARRLQASGLRPFTQEGLVSNLPPPRLAAALAFPIAAEDILHLLAQVQKNTQTQENKNHDNA
ncbi:MAG: type I-U CRISPR-associated protein Csx17, partial [Kamptonema sp. SIO4C4]|nr:type I-U CRISPR-associated protein Csx17 [Kamptonema sp. SIO4C4]